MKINNLKVTKKLKKILVLATLGTLTLSTTGCSRTNAIESEEIVQENKKTFQPGEHVIAVVIKDRSVRPTVKIVEYQAHAGYEPIGISATAYGRDNYHPGASHILFRNTEEVIVEPTEITADGKYLYEDFGVPTNKKEQEARKETDTTIEYLPGEHIISIPYYGYSSKNMQFEYHDGYEIIGIANSSYGMSNQQDNRGCILYVNTEKVKVKKDISKDELPFGTPLEEEKVLEK